MGVLQNDSGFMSIRQIFWLVFLSIAVYIGSQVIPPYVGYVMLKSEVKNELKVAHLYTDKEIREHIVEKAREWSVPLDSYENIRIDRREFEIKVKVSYEVPVTLFDKEKYTRVFYYDIKVIAELKQKAQKEDDDW